MLLFLNIIVTAYATDKIYTINNSAKTWNNSMKECESDGGYLLTLNSQEILNALNDGELRDQISTTQLWTGLRKTDNSDECGPYTWHSGESSGTWGNWYNGEPNRCDTEKCIRIQKGKWRTTQCENIYKFICEKEASSTTVITDSTATSEATENGFTELVSTDSSENQEAVVTPSHPPSLYNLPNVTTDSTATSEATENASSDLPENSSSMSNATENGFTKSVSNDSNETQKDVTFSQLYQNSTFSNCCTGKYKELKCGSVKWTTNRTYTDEALETEIKKLKEELKVQRNKTKIYIRSKMSVYDNRNSSVTMGMIGIFIIITTVFFPVAVDAIRLITFIKNCGNKDIQCSRC